MSNEYEKDKNLSLLGKGVDLSGYTPDVQALIKQGYPAHKAMSICLMRNLKNINEDGSYKKGK